MRLHGRVDAGRPGVVQGMPVVVVEAVVEVVVVRRRNCGILVHGDGRYGDAVDGANLGQGLALQAGGRARQHRHGAVEEQRRDECPGRQQADGASSVHASIVAAGPRAALDNAA